MNNNKKLAEGFHNLLFLKIFQAFRIAIQPKNLIIALMAVIAICLVGWLMDISDTVVTTADGTTELDVYLSNPKQVSAFIETSKQLGSDYSGVFATLWHFAAASFNNAVVSLLQLNLQQFSLEVTEYCRAVKWACRYHTIYCIIFGLIKLCIIAVAGGAICRIASLQLARGEKPGLFEAIRFSTKKFTNFFSAPLVPLGIVIAFGILIFIVGLIAKIPYAGELIIGISMPITLLIGALITIIIIGAAAGLNLMFPAVAYDGSDCFDAVSRSMSYVYAKPWRMAFYTAVALIYGAICYIFVRFLVFLLLSATRLFLYLGISIHSSKGADKLSAIWPENEFMNLLSQLTFANKNWSQSIAAFFVYICLLFIVGLLLSYIISFYYSATTIIYSLMRNRVDGTAFEDVYMYPDESAATKEGEMEVSEQPQNQPVSPESVSKQKRPQRKPKRRKKSGPEQNPEN